MKITLELTDNNGIIKNIESIKDNGGIFKKVDIYPLDTNSNTDFTNNKMFLSDLIKDLGIYTGNIHDKKTLVINHNYGTEYSLSKEELLNEYLVLSNKLKQLEKQLSVSDETSKLLEKTDVIING